jgi:hypothetical protein
MDDEDFELLRNQIHERFDIEFDSYAAEVGTVGGLHSYILWKLGLTHREEACLCPPTFFALRKALASQLGLDSTTITLDSSLAKLLPWRRRRRLWRKLSESSNLEFPELRDNPGMTLGAALVYIAMAIPMFGVFLIYDYSSFAAVAAMLVLILVLQVPIWLLFVRLGRLVQFRLPYGCQTVGELVKYLVALNPVQLRERFGAQSLAAETARSVAKQGLPHCTNVAVFARIRKAFVKSIGCYRSTIRPETLLLHVMDGCRRRSTWEAVERNLGWKLPELRRSRFVVGLCAVGYFVFAWLAYREHGNLWLSLLLAFPYSIFAYYCTMPLAVDFPTGRETVADLAKAVTDLNYGRIAVEYDSANPDEVWSILRDLVAEASGLRSEDVTPDTPLVDAGRVLWH